MIAQVVAKGQRSLLFMPASFDDMHVMSVRPACRPVEERTECSSDPEANHDAHQDGAPNRERSDAPHQPQHRKSGTERRGVGHGRSECEHERHCAGEILPDRGATLAKQ